MIDLDFIQFYIKKNYNQSLTEYFDVNPCVITTWRNKGLPKGRMNEFVVREKSFSVHELFDKIYPKQT